MGNCCRKLLDENSSLIAKNENEIEFPIYQSKFDNIYFAIETKYNCFININIVQYMNLLEHFEISNSTIFFSGPYKTDFSIKDSFLGQKLMEEEFQSFLENQILNIPDILLFFGSDDSKISLFKQIYMNIFKTLQYKLNKELNENEIKKINLIPIGLLYCKSTKIDKVKLFFDLFKNENEKFCKSELLNDYLLSAFLISSYCMLKVRKDLGDNDKFGHFKMESIAKIVSYCTFNDCQNLVKYFNDKFFDKEELTWTEFKKKFNTIIKDHSFSWIFSTMGVRHYLEKLDEA